MRHLGGLQRANAFLGEVQRRAALAPNAAYRKRRC